MKAPYILQRLSACPRAALAKWSSVIFAENGDNFRRIIDMDNQAYCWNTDSLFDHVTSTRMRQGDAANYVFEVPTPALRWTASAAAAEDVANGNADGEH